MDKSTEIAVLKAKIEQLEKDRELIISNIKRAYDRCIEKEKEPDYKYVDSWCYGTLKGCVESVLQYEKIRKEIESMKGD